MIDLWSARAQQRQMDCALSLSLCSSLIRRSSGQCLLSRHGLPAVSVGLVRDSASWCWTVYLELKTAAAIGMQPWAKLT